MPTRFYSSNIKLNEKEYQNFIDRLKFKNVLNFKYPKERNRSCGYGMFNFLNELFSLSKFRNSSKLFISHHQTTLNRDESVKLIIQIWNLIKEYNSDKNHVKFTVATFGKTIINEPSFQSQKGVTLFALLL